jgi:hypothetical protein
MGNSSMLARQMDDLCKSNLYMKQVHFNFSNTGDPNLIKTNNINYPQLTRIKPAPRMEFVCVRVGRFDQVPYLQSPTLPLSSRPDCD